ncbi:MAG: NAD(P)-dependent oxidoreductase [Chloroflexi bacterium]|nr:NAD(P)-dependent oxidoreductase [Chloroflexota bacterium]
MNSSANPLAADLDHVLDHTRDVWDELRGERLFITGGTGFFGCWLMESFLWANDRLNLNSRATVLTRSPDSFRDKVPHLAGHKAVTVLQGDVRTFDFPSGAFSHVIHAASESSLNLSESQLIRMLDTIVGGTRHTLEFAIRAGAKKFLFTSSGAVYGKQPPDVKFISEDDSAEWRLPGRIDLASIYREGKRLSEMECNIFAQTNNLETKIARCFAFVGPYLPLDAQFAIGNFIRDGLAGRPIQIKGDGTPFRSYLYAADVAIWLWIFLFRGQTCRPYNAGSDQAVSIADLAKTAAKLIEPPPKIEISRTQRAGQKAERYIPSTQRAQTELGLQTWIGLEEAIKRTIAWHRRQQER